LGRIDFSRAGAGDTDFLVSSAKVTLRRALVLEDGFMLASVTAFGGPEWGIVQSKGGS